MNNSVLISIQPKWCELIANGKKTVEVRKSRPKLDTPFKCYIYCTTSSYKGKYLHTSNKRGRLLFWENPNNTNITVQPENYNYMAYTCRGKVIGEFVCDDISKFTAEFTDGKTYEDIRYCYLNEYEEEEEMIVVSNELSNPNNSWICKESCLSFDDFKKYIGINFHDIPFYAWHISDLKIYDEPKELKRFGKFECEYCGSKKECFAPETIYDCSLQRIDTHLNNNNMYRCDGDFLSLKCPPQSWCYVEELRE